MKPVEPLFVAHLIPEVERLLVELLRSLAPEEWDRPTIVPRWTVRQVVAHLLDTSLRKLSTVRDGFIAYKPQISSNADLVAFINDLNAKGVDVYGRLSGPVLTSLVEAVTPAYCDYHLSLDPDGPAAFPVSWAGEFESRNWFDTARELTERWHHQEQIRLATGRGTLRDPEFYRPVLDCFLRALPHTYRDVDAAEGTRVVIEVPDVGSWMLVRESGRWNLWSGGPGKAVGVSAVLVLPGEIAWRVFTKGIARAEAESKVEVRGDSGLATRVLDAVAIVG
jgi:uncharacterized protein (TIGR03083 family)